MRSSCPTVVVRADRHGKSTRPIVVGVDGSRQSEATLRFAISEATLLGTHVDAVYAYRVPAVALPVEASGMIGDITTHQRQAAERQIEDIVSGHRDHVPPGVRDNVHVESSDPADMLVSASAGVALAVVGSRGRGAFRGMLLGSVSQRLLHRADSPVVVVHDGTQDEADDQL